jgi:hypothetical protein
MKIECAAALLAILALSGCSTAAERQQAVERARAAVIADAKSICASVGHAPDTPPFSACVEKMFSDAVQVEQQNMNRAVAAYRPSVMCNRIGSTTICN